MYTRERREDPNFSPQELLYQRYRREHWTNGVFIGLGFRFPQQSVNRGKYSEPRDVLFSETGQYAGYGVLQYEVRNVRVTQKNDDNETFNLYPKHVPLEDNYAHTELWCECPERQNLNALPSPAVRKYFRTELGRCARPVIEAEG
jgi:hypothetical protein